MRRHKVIIITTLGLLVSRLSGLRQPQMHLLCVRMNLAAYAVMIYHRTFAVKASTVKQTMEESLALQRTVTCSLDPITIMGTCGHVRIMISATEQWMRTATMCMSQLVLSRINLAAGDLLESKPTELTAQAIVVAVRVILVNMVDLVDLVNLELSTLLSISQQFGHQSIFLSE